MSWSEELDEALSELARSGLFRDPEDALLRRDVIFAAEAAGVPFVDAGSNDYLGYGRRGALDVVAGADSRGEVEREGLVQTGGSLGGERLGESSVDAGARRGVRASVSRETEDLRWGLGGDRSEGGAWGFPPASGAGASRLLGGTSSSHLDLEAVLGDWVGHEAALLFSSGYAANVGLISAIAGSNDGIFSDSLNHASIIDGCRLSRATSVVYPHRDLRTLRQQLESGANFRRRFIVSESYFSMDGDSPDLVGLRSLADEFDAVLVIDEAHALGIVGPRGAGIAASVGVLPDIIVGTLGKSVGLQGAFVAGPRVLRTWLWNRARSFVYSTATSPVLAEQAAFHVKHIQKNDGARAELCARARNLRQVAIELGLSLVEESHGPIVSILMGTVERALRSAASLRQQGILAYPIRPPTVPVGTARLRLTVTTAMSRDAYEHLTRSLATCVPR